MSRPEKTLTVDEVVEILASDLGDEPNQAGRFLELLNEKLLTAGFSQNEAVECRRKACAKFQNLDRTIVEVVVKEAA